MVRHAFPATISMKPVLDGLRALGAARLIALGAVGLGMLVMLGLLALHGGAPAPQALLYSDLDLREAAQIADALDCAHIGHQELGGGDRIMVSAADVARAAAPLRPAEDAVVLDTTVLGPEEAFARAMAIIEDRRREKAPPTRH